VVSACDGINYLITPEKVKQAFLNVYKSLKAGGIFIFDISTAYKLKAMDGQLYSEDTDEVTYIWRNSFEGDVISMDIAFFVREEDENYFRFDENHLQRAHKQEEIEEWLKECGFDIISVTDNYTDSPVKEDTLRITFCAKRKER
jgi:predicted TPR repeat methyltransferase